MTPGQKDILIVRTGVANTASVIAAFFRAEANARISENAEEIASAKYVVLPGVGSFAAGMSELNRGGVAEAIVSRVRERRATLAICLGLQLFCQESEESPGVRGLGMIPAEVRRFSNAVRCPQLGWNTVLPGEGCRVLQPGFAYFAHSFRIAAQLADWSVSLTQYDGEYISAIEQGPIVATQFHPELSSTWGIDLLRRWLGTGEGSC